MFKNRLLWKLCGIIAVGTVLLFGVIDYLTRQAEWRMSFIAKHHQQQLLAYAEEAEKIYRTQDETALAEWLQALQAKEDTWAAIVVSEVNPLAGGKLSPQFVDGFRLGRDVQWKIHLYFKDNPIMDLPFADKHTHFLIQLPQRMRPGDYFAYTRLLLQIALPLALLSLLSLIVYRHLMTPLKKLEAATKAFSQGHFQVRVKKRLGDREDELAALAGTFDQMAERTGELIVSQRQLLSDLSHELRTPLARLDMAIDVFAQQQNPEQALARLRYESKSMAELVENALTLAWLTNEKPQLNKDNFDLVELIHVICEDARFEYPKHTLLSDLPDKALLYGSSQRALGQALENIVRNALSHSGKAGEVLVRLKATEKNFVLTVKDQGPGVPEALLNHIFRPFFQVSQARSANHGVKTSAASNKKSGFGLGLALAQRQLEAVGGAIRAANHYQDSTGIIAGLEMTITLPIKAKPSASSHS